MDFKRTRQGLRDLNSIPSKSAGRRLELPPEQSGGKTCMHKRGRFDADGDFVCQSCGYQCEAWEAPGA
jgi:hypothetical protein